MSFFVDDNEFQQSTEFKCSSDPQQQAFRKAVERAIKYARGRGVTPIAALGNSDEARRAVQNDTATTYDGSAPFCPEYAE